MPLTVPMDEELRLAMPDLTRAERQLAGHILGPEHWRAEYIAMRSSTPTAGFSETGGERTK